MYPEREEVVVMPKSRLIFSLVVASIVFVTSNLFAHTEVSIQQARSMLDIGLIPPALSVQLVVNAGVHRDLIILDVRQYTSEFCTGHIPGAINCVWNSTLNSLEDGWQALPRKGDILVVCGSGTRSHKAANFLESNGFTRVYDMGGGMSAWNTRGWETVKCGHDDPGIVDIIGDLDGDGKVGLQETIYILQRVRKLR
jgi:rhodanese-related sulfurtransferase